MLYGAIIGQSIKYKNPLELKRKKITRFSLIFYILGSMLCNPGSPVGSPGIINEISLLKIQLGCF